MHKQFENFTKAKKEYELALDINPHSFEAHVNLVHLLELSFPDEHDLIFEHYRNALEIDFGDAMTHYNLAIFLEEKAKDFMGALECYSNAIHMNPDYAEVMRII